MFKFMVKALLICGIFSLASCSSSNDKYINEDETINIRLVEEETFSIKSSNPVTIKKGADAVFKVEIKELFEFDSSSEGTYDSQHQTYTVGNNNRSRNVRLLTKKRGVLSLNVINDDSKGNVSVYPCKDYYNSGEKITIDVKPIGDNRFMCFTKTNPYRPSGNWDAGGKPVSFRSSYSFEIESDMTIVTNYFERNLLVIDYDSNGGETIDGDTGFALDYNIPQQFTKPSTVLGTHYLFKDGYTLESFNSKADGSGVRVGVGSAVDTKLASQNIIKLYAQWAKWTDYSQFEFIENEDSCSLKKYSGDDAIVVLPNYYHGKPLIRIVSSAFENKNLNTLIVNENMETIDNNAIVNCENFTELLLFTSITSMTKDFLSGTNNLKLLKLNNTLYTYDASQRNRDMIGQIQTIENTQKERILLFGPSTMRYNQPIKEFKNKYPSKFVYLCGMQGSGNYRLALELALSTLNEKDYICPQLYERSLNPSASGYYTFVYLKYDFDCLLRVNISDYLDVIFNVLPLFVSDFSQNQTDDIFLNQRFGGYDSDGMVNYESSTDDPDNKDPSISYSFNSYLKQSYFDFIPKLIDKSMVLNNHVLPCWSSYNINSVVGYETFTEYETFAKSILNDYVFFDSIFDNIYAGDLFRKNDSIHLSMKGGAVRAEKWSSKWKELDIIS